MNDVMPIIPEELIFSWGSRHLHIQFC